MLMSPFLKALRPVPQAPVLGLAHFGHLLALLMAGLMAAFAWSGEAKPLQDWRWMDVAGEGGMVLMAAIWITQLRSSRPGGRVTSWLCLGLAGILLGVGALVAALVYATQRGRGGTLTGGVRRASGFMLWAVALLQVVAQIGRAAPAQLPGAILAFYSAVDVLRFSGAAAGTLPPACTWDSPFGKDEGMMAAALALLALLALALMR